MKKLLLTVVATVFLFVGSSSAADMKIGYVDIKTAMESTKAYSNGMKRLSALQNKKKKELEGMRNQLQKLDKELQLQAMSLTNDSQAAKQQKLLALKKKFDRKLQDASDELKAEKRKLDTKMIGRFYEAVRDYGEKNNYDIIVPKNTTIYTSGSQDITTKITEILDAKK